MASPQSITVVLGGAAGAWDELARASQIAPVRHIFAVNDAAMHYPGKLDAFVTLHPEKLSGWLGARRDAGLPEPAAVVSHTREVEGIPPHIASIIQIAEYQWPEMKGVEGGSSGSSGLFATKLALERTALPVVLCGVPMQASRAHFFNEQPWGDVADFLKAWENVARVERLARVRSMSGWTAELLGAFQ